MMRVHQTIDAQASPPKQLGMAKVFPRANTSMDISFRFKNTEYVLTINDDCVLAPSCSTYDTGTVVWV